MASEEQTDNCVYTGGVPLEFSPFTMDIMDDYLAHYANAITRASDYSFTNLWGWAEEYGMEWSRTKNLFWLRRTKPTVQYWAPVGNWDAVDWSACDTFLSIKPDTEFIRVPEEIMKRWVAALGDRIAVEEDRDQWDYLYNAAELATLSGRKYQKKKNHLNAFKRLFTWSYHPMTADCVEQVLQLQKEWRNSPEHEGMPALEAEDRAVVRVLEQWDTIPNLHGGTLYVDNKMIAYTVGEELTKDTLVVHFEKALISYRGAYQAINMLFAEDAGAGFQYLNREQDLGEEGLRHAKMSYNPVDWEKKYRVRFLR